MIPFALIKQSVSIFMKQSGENSETYSFFSYNQPQTSCFMLSCRNKDLDVGIVSFLSSSALLDMRPGLNLCRILKVAPFVLPLLSPLRDKDGRIGKYYCSSSCWKKLEDTLKGCFAAFSLLAAEKGWRAVQERNCCGY